MEELRISKRLKLVYILVIVGIVLDYGNYSLRYFKSLMLWSWLEGTVYLRRRIRTKTRVRIGVRTRARTNPDPSQV